MTNDDVLKLISQFGDQTFNALLRMMKAESLRRRMAYGTIEIFEAIQSCRTGIARQLLKEINAARFSISHPEIGVLEYAADDRVGMFTSKAIKVFQRAISVAKENEDNFPGNDHLLYAMANTPETAFQESMILYEVKTHELDQKLRVAIGLEGYAKPRTNAYETLAYIEIALKKIVVGVLEAEYGESWWSKAIPCKTRKKCVIRREDEGCKLNAQAYFDLIDLKEIMEKKWDLFKKEMQSATKAENDGKKINLGWIREINDIRNAVMHPSKREIYSADVDLLQPKRGIVRCFVDQFPDLRMESE